jgi:hypothetical protein
MIVTFLIILFVQGLNCFLEIGFLTGNLEESNLRKYRIIGSQMQRKLNKSLLFGKPLDQIDYARLLTDIIPPDIDNLHIIDDQGTVLFSARPAASPGDFHMTRGFTMDKNADGFQIHIPLADRTRVKGNIVMKVSLREIREQTLFLIRRSVVTFLGMLVVGLPLLYLVLTWFVNRPYNRFIKEMDTWIETGQYDRLQERGIDMSPLFACQDRIQDIRSGQWLSLDHRDMYDAVDGVDMKPDRTSWERALYRRLTARLNIN